MKSKIISILKIFFTSYFWIFILVFILDIVTKNVMESILLEKGSIVVIPGFLTFSLVYNTGAGFGIFGNIDNVILRRTLLIGVSVIMSLCFLIYYIVKYKKLSTVYKILIMLLFAGAFGNLIDRAFYKDGKVIDFIDVDLGAYKTFPVFNIADSSLVIGIAILIIAMIVEEAKAYKNKKQSLNNGSSVENNKEASDNDDK